MDKNNLEIAVLNSISKTVVHERNIPNLLKTVLDILHREMGLLRGTFTLMHGDTLFIEASNGLTEEDAPAVGYATVYPLTMFLRVLTAQMLIIFFVS